MRSGISIVNQIDFITVQFQIPVEVRNVLCENIFSGAFK